VQPHRSASFTSLAVPKTTHLTLNADKVIREGTIALLWFMTLCLHVSVELLSNVAARGFCHFITVVSGAVYRVHLVVQERK